MSRFFVNPDPFYTPRVSIGAFNLKNSLGHKANLDTRLLGRLGPNWMTTSSGKKAIRMAFGHLQVSPNWHVGIVTTSGNSYVSKCVTETISDYCTWEMYGKGSKVDLLFVIHEFGALLTLKRMKEYRLLGIPIINDFAYSFLSLFSSGRNDFVDEINLTSFPKAFNVPCGGAVHIPGNTASGIDKRDSSELLKGLEFELNTDSIKQIIEIRKRNREFYSKKLTKHGYRVIWNNKGICPGVCMITPLKSVNLQNLKDLLQRNGIEASVFYGQTSFFVPVHHLLTEKELNYVCFMIGAFK
jgi:hypothetical protein